MTASPMSIGPTDSGNPDNDNVRGEMTEYIRVIVNRNNIQDIQTEDVIHIVFIQCTVIYRLSSRLKEHFITS